MWERRNLTFRIALILLVVAPPAAQSADASLPQRIFRDVDGKPLPFQTDEEAEAFLLSAAVTSQRDIGTGVTKPKQLVLKKDGLSVHAAFNYVDREGKNEKLMDGIQYLKKLNRSGRACL